MTEAAKGIAGHEGAGVIVAVGDDMNRRWKMGDRAGIKWVASVWEFCTNGQDGLHCPKQTNLISVSSDRLHSMQTQRR